ncbi:MAG: Crp/Fnr family transcriptional regulator [Rubrivivax sp.]|nr:Crp/Fnr family transcriptional regulator [Rubrivivax sp.]
MSPLRRLTDPSADSSAYRLDLLQALPASESEALRKLGVVHRYRDGATLAQRGQPMRSVLVLTKGRLRAVTSLIDGREHLMRWVEPGEAVGVASVLAQLPFQVDLIASGPCEVRSIPGEAFVDVMRRNSAAGLVVARLLAARLSEVYDHVVAQAQGRLQDRVQASLRHLAAENGEQLTDGRVRLRVSHQDVSDAVGASRQRVNGALHSLQRAGYVVLGYRQITLAMPPPKRRRTGG